VAAQKIFKEKKNDEEEGERKKEEKNCTIHAAILWAITDLYPRLKAVVIVEGVNNTDRCEYI